jgi:hypothetical protein
LTCKDRNQNIEIKTALIVVRTYPVPAKQGVEVSCTAAITDRGEWLRLFPVPYRRLNPAQKFHKYQWIEIGVEKASDPRLESYKILQETIKIKSEILSTDAAWRDRKSVVFPLKWESMCALQKHRGEHKHPTLGLIKPIIKRLRIRPIAAEWSDAERAILSQGDLFETEQAEVLEKIPFEFSYEFDCSEPGCNGHRMKCTDWEMGQSWRKWREQYGNDWQTAFSQKYEREMRDKLDTYFYVGTIHQHPDAWIVVGLFYPPKVPKSLFD